ncbi:MAG: response regulator transcription factor [Symbiobacterium sp.]|uniref:response regulator transcription factor n=1 Tax=Symbiobacterium sp. TaxID=1971213 RepID=UPI0034646036
MAEARRYRIMIVEDDEKIASILAAALDRYGYDVILAQDYARIKEEFVAARPDLVLLDVNLPRYDGFYWCRQIRTVSRAPILFISARSDQMDQVRAIEHGADDYITKPFNLELALAKVGAALRRAYGEYALTRAPDVLSAGGLLLDRSTNRVSLGDRAVELSPKEFRLLWCLAERAGAIVAREELLEALWDDTEFVDDNTLTVNVARVRRRLEELGLANVIETKRGQGYCLALPGGD